MRVCLFECVWSGVKHMGFGGGYNRFSLCSPSSRHCLAADNGVVCEVFVCGWRATE